MKLYFNTSGPCVPGQHYMLPPERRLDRVMQLIEQGRYFTLHAGRQTGKTTSARWLAKYYNMGEMLHATWVDVETAREEPDPAQAMRSVLNELEMSLARDLATVDRPQGEAIEELLRDPPTAILRYLQQICAKTSKPLVLLVDEADGLVGQTAVSFLSQLRRGYMDRSEVAFPHSVALIGVRQVRDYALSIEEQRAVSWLGTTSPFNITAEASTLAPFGREEVGEFLFQHTETTGQRFDDGAVEQISELSQGHPWLVNALADEAVGRVVTDPAAVVEAEHVDTAKETLILERRSHIDSLIARLREIRVRRILEPMLTGGTFVYDGLEDDLQYVQGLGLICLRSGSWQIANPVYREIVPRALTFVAQTSLHQQSEWYVRADGTLDVAKLLSAFQAFWRQDGHLAARGFAYREAGPHLMLMAFLQRIVNGGGRVEREYGVGRGALDLLVIWRDERHAIEVKLRRDTETEREAATQVAVYLEGLGLKEGWLVLFDLRKKKHWNEKIFVRSLAVAGRTVRLVGC